MDNEALQPDTPAIQELLDPEEVVENKATSDALDVEKQLAAVSSTPGWQMIKERMETDIQAFRTGQGMTVDASTPLAEVGQKFIIASTVAQHLQAYLDMVNSSVAAVIEAERGNSGN